MTRRRIPFFIAPLLVLGCDRKPSDQVTVPADPVASVKPSAEVKPLVVSVTEPRCKNGALLSEADAGATDTSEVALFGDLVLTGQTLRVEGLVPADVEKVVCAGYVDFSGCFDDPTVETKTIGITLTIGEGGHVAAAQQIDATLGDDALATCVTRVARALSFGKPSQKNATVSYALAAKRVKLVKMIETGATLTGRLPPEVVKRIVRANFPRLRACYEAGLKRDPTLKGTVSTKFVIDASGAVESATSAGGSLHDAIMEACIQTVFRSLAFPAPEGGKVLVTYPIDFQNED